MDFALSDDQNALIDLAESILTDHCDDAAARTLADSGESLDRNLWTALSGAGLLGVGIAEDHGGHGFGMLETALVLERAGKWLAPVPLRDTLIGAQTLAVSDGAVNADLIRRVIAGDGVIASACEEPGAAWTAPAATARRNGDGWVLDGEKAAVAWGVEADVVLVSARLADTADAGLLVVPVNAAGVSRSAQRGTDGTPLAQLSFSAVALPAEAALMQDGDAGAALQNHLGRMRVALAATQLGIASEALRRTAEYTASRMQFGRPIGSMQAVQQRAADGYIDCEAMRSTVWRAAWLIDQGVFDQCEIAVAKYWAAAGGHRITHTAQHHHGGLGADVTYPIHRFLLAARAVESALGGASPMLAELGALIAAGTVRPLSAIGGNHDGV